MNSARLTLITFFGLTLVCLLIGTVGILFLRGEIERSEFRLQVAANADYAMRFAASLESQLQMGISPEEVQRYLQRSFESVPAGHGRFLCMISDEGKVLCHPNDSVVGAAAADMSLMLTDRSRRLTYAQWVAEGHTEAFHLDAEGKPVEMLRRAPVAGTEWNVIVHTDLAMLREESRALTGALLSVLLPMLAALVLLGTLVVRILGRRYETLIESANRDLERRVSERTTELERTVHELRQTRHALQHNEKMALMGQLLAGIAHEIRNPLGAIALFAGSLEESAATEEDREAAARIIHSTQRCDLLVHNLLAFARNDPPSMAPVSVNDIVEMALRLSRTELKSASIQIDCQLAGNDPLIRADRLQIEQVVLNLITNSLQELRDGKGGEGVIRVYTKDSPGTVHIVVEDNGRGVPSGTEDRLFQPFHTTRSEGTGLGLSLCRQFVEHHGGTIRYERSEDLGGARFVIELPRLVTKSGEVPAVTYSASTG